MTEAEVEALRHFVLAASFGVSAIAGFAMSRSGFCTMGAVADLFSMGRALRFRMWLLAIGVAILGTQTMAALGLVDLTQSLYTGSRLPWLSLVLGGALFGFGMVLASGCGSKTLIRLGSGNLKSLVVFVVMGLAAYMSLRGVLAPLRANGPDQITLTLGSGQDLPSLLATTVWASKTRLHLVLGALIGGALIVQALFDASVRRHRASVAGAVVVGLAVTALWYISSHVGFIEEDPRTLEPRFLGSQSGRPEALSFVAPVAYTLDWLLFWTDRNRVLTIGIASVLGMVLGAWLDARLSGRFRWEGFGGVDDLAAHLVGAVMMGAGGVMALGCTIGQGLSGLSTLAVGSMLAWVAMVAGAWAALRFQVWRIERAG